jgi:purine-nucleoside phosphorylase
MCNDLCRDIYLPMTIKDEPRHKRQQSRGINDDAIINPTDGNEGEKLGRVAVMVSSQNDLRMLCDRLQIAKNNFSRLFNSKLYVHNLPSQRYSLVGPVIGAPYAVMVLEKLIAHGAKKILFIGWCGAISSSVKIGEIIVPTGSFIDEGTSRHYEAAENKLAAPSQQMLGGITQILKNHRLPFHEGIVWTTDAIYRETPEKVGAYQSQNVLAVEMEISALFTVGEFRKVNVAGILVVSDDLSSGMWKPGFKERRFKRTRKQVSEVVVTLFRSS